MVLCCILRTRGSQVPKIVVFERRRIRGCILYLQIHIPRPSACRRPLIVLHIIVGRFLEFRFPL